MNEPAVSTTDLPAQDSRLKQIQRGMLRTLPVLMGYVPVGFAYGVLANKAGLPVFHTLLMSLIVYAGSAQLIAVTLFSSGIAPLSIIATTFIVNLRHFLFSAALAPHLTGWRKRELAGFAFELTDETFALHSTRFAEGPATKTEIFASNITAQVTWVISTILGMTAGNLIGDVKPFGLDYALPAMFIALLVMQVKDRLHALAALAAGVFSVLLMMAGVTQWNVILATLVAATLGLMVEQWTKKLWRSPLWA